MLGSRDEIEPPPIEQLVVRAFKSANKEAAKPALSVHLISDSTVQDFQRAMLQGRELPDGIKVRATLPAD